ncbi:MAG: response regulator transcription factor [Prevotellaceae bacterium]|nr:response regulator transcription factor [Prevotellaceae bacterium]MDY3856983.1 response regulator transcription factor [Bacteroidaceae bacterium]
MMHKPVIALVMDDALQNVGLKMLLEKYIPFARVYSFSSVDEMDEGLMSQIFHYFISRRQLDLHRQELMPMIHKVIVLGTFAELKDLKGIVHGLATDQTPHAFVKSLMGLQQHVHHGFSRYPAEMAESLREEDERVTSQLTAREKDIIKMVAQGKASKEIAGILHISPLTVNTHRKNIMDKLQAHSATQLVIYAVNHGLVSPDEI